jgi:hypothetical protein
VVEGEDALAPRGDAPNPRKHPLPRLRKRKAGERPGESAPKNPTPGSEGVPPSTTIKPFPSPACGRVGRGEGVVHSPLPPLSPASGGEGGRRPEEGVVPPGAKRHKI